MQARYTYIHFEQIGQKPKTSVWACRSNSSKAILGMIEWYPPWRQYCFFPAPDCVFNVSCLDDIKHFIGQLKTQGANP
jgi:hypothetical protein